MEFRVEPVTEDSASDWRRVHNLVIPASPLSEEDVRERLTRNRLTLGFDDGRLVANATLRPPTGDDSVATVIVRVLPEFRGRGYGTAYAEWILERAAELAPEHIETVVLVANEDGLRFAVGRGFREVRRYEVDDAAYVDLRLTRPIRSSG